MAASYKIFKTFLLLCGLFHIGQPQETVASISQNFCQVLQQEDNLSCPEDPIEGQACFDRDLLCDGTDNCGNAIDEGPMGVFSPLECDFVNRDDSMFDCGNGVEIELEELCDGTDDCVNGARPGDDETAIICDNKCLLPYYGNCDLTRICVNSRNGVNCGDCFPGPNNNMILIVGENACGALTVESMVFTEGAQANPVQVCATLSPPAGGSFSFTTPVTADVTFTPGSAVLTGDYNPNPAAQTLSFTAADLEDCITFDIVDDTTLESTESFTVTVTRVPPTSLETVTVMVSGTVTIIDNDMPMFGFTASSYSGTETSMVVNAFVTITNGVTLDSDVTVNCVPSFSAGSGADIASSGDFTVATVPVTFIAGGATTVSCPVPVANDNIIEDTEEFSLSLQLVAGQLGSLSAMDTATGFITETNPMFGFNPLTYSVMESNSVQVVTIEAVGQVLGPFISRTLTINSQTFGLTNPATPGTIGSGVGDFVAVVGGMVTFGPGSSSQSFTYTLLDDDLNEQAEMFNLVLSVGAGVAASIAAGSGTGTVTIAESDTLMFQFELNPVPAAEGTPTVDVCVNLVAGSPISPVTLFLDPSPGTASVADFGDATMSVTFSGTTTQDCGTFTINDDTIMEPPESFTVTATGGNFIGGATSTQVTIADNDMPEFGFISTFFSGTEASMLVNAFVAITNGVTLTSDVTVNCVPSLFPVPDTDIASFGDLTVATVALTFSPGGVTTQTCPIPVANDNIIEETEEFQLSLQLVAGQGSLSATLSMATGSITDTTPMFGFNPLTYSVAESDSAQQVSIVEVNGQTFGTGVTRTLIINSQTFGSTITNPATPGIQGSGVGDFVAVVNGMVTLGPASSQSFIYNLIGDDFNEPAEMFNLVLSVGAGVDASIAAGSGTGTVTIGPSDPTLFEFDLNPVPAAEGPTTSTVDVCVNLVSGIPSSPVTIMLIPSPGSASNADFGGGTMSITFFGTTTQACGIFSINDDNIMEPTESFTVTATGGTFVGGATSTQVTIADNDNPVFQFIQQEFDSSEATSPAVATIQLVSNTVLTTPVTIQVTTLGTGSATGSPIPGGGDFQITTMNLMFPVDSGPGSVESFEVPVVNDLFVENEEDIDIIAMIIAGSGSFSGGDNTAQINIIDNDVLTVGFQFSEVSFLEDDMMVQQVCLSSVGSGTTLAPGVSVMASISTSPGNGIAFPAALPSTATMVQDYDPTTIPTMVTFTSISSPIQCVEIDIVADLVDEPTKEQFFANAVSLSSQLSIPAPGNQVSVLICDDDVIIAGFNQTHYFVNESGPPVPICIDIFEGTVRPAGLVITVQNVDGGTAELTADFVAIDQDLFFMAGTGPNDPNSRVCFNFLPNTVDLCVEDMESIIIEASSLIPDVQFTQSGNQAVIYIVDDDTIPVMIVPPIPNGSPDFSVNENMGPIQVCVQAVANVGVLKREVTVMLSQADGTAIGAGPGLLADFCTTEVIFTFEPGQEGSQMCTDIDINNDMICEGPEDFSVILESCPDGGTTISNSPGTVTIIDDDVAEITAEYDINIPENIGVFKIHVLLLGQKAPGRQCLVTASTMDDTAVSTGINMDFMSAVETVALDADDQVAYIELEIVDDGLCEGTEQFQVFLATSSPGCAIQDGVSPITVMITDDEINTSVGDDPHFSIVLPSGRLLCYTVQGEHGFAFNLISNKKMTMNARFVPDSRRSEVTWIGSMGIIVRDNVYRQSNSTALRFEALEKKIYIGDKVELAAKNIERMTFKNGKLTISEAPPSDKFKYPSIYVDLQDVGITFTMKFLSEHLDIFWHRTGGKIPDSHGIIGQFFRTGVEIDEVRKILIMPNKEPVPVMRRPVWSFMEREKTDDQLCWTAMNPGYQGEGLIDGTYYDYLVDDVMTSEFQFKKL